MDISKEQENLISNVKLKIKAECRFLLNAANTHDSAVGTLIHQILSKGCVSGSILSNFYHRTPKDQSDFDIFVKYGETFFEKTKHVLDGKVSNLVIQEWGDENYVAGGKHSLKFDIGKLSPMNINIIFVDDYISFEVMTSHFDFEVCNWFYEWKSDSMYVSEECLNGLEKHELNYTYHRKQYLEKKKNSFIMQMQMGNDMLEQSYFESEINRLKKYVNLKKYVLSDETRKILEDINTNCVEIWKI